MTGPVIRAFEPADEPAIVALWHECDLVRPWNDPHQDIARKLTQNPELFLVLETEEGIQATAMFGYDGHRGSMNYLGVTGTARGRGYADALIGRGEELLTATGCPKLNLQVRDTNSPAVELYRRIGYEIDPVVSLGKRLIADEP